MSIHKHQWDQRAQQAQQQHTHSRQQRRRCQHPQRKGQEGQARHAPTPDHACRSMGWHGWLISGSAWYERAKGTHKYLSISHNCALCAGHTCVAGVLEAMQAAAHQ